MNKWVSEWGVWVLTVACLILFGILIGHDITKLNGVSSVLSAFGTFMLGVAALIAIPVWKHQEKAKFQAKIAANLYAELSNVRQQLHTVTFYVQEYSAGNGRGTNDRTDIVFNTKLMQPIADLEAEVDTLIRVMKTTVSPQVPLLGADFIKRTQTLEHEFTLLITEPWTKISFQKYTHMLQLLDELIVALASKALFQR